ncbi:NUDIX hydrolase domain-like protein [Hypoxylon crocopeplum]|nr:NUDIX hydrolase domain-like protein [Hypoxylon crocopeplum]
MEQANETDPHTSGGFAIEDSLAVWNIPANTWLAKHGKEHLLDGIATGIVVFGPGGKVLLVQRASHDSMPNRWEVPGGAVDVEDPSILFGGARELLEETRFTAKRFMHVVNEEGQLFSNRTGMKTFCRFVFIVEVESSEGVRLDPNEHQDFLWASEEEVRKQRVEDRDTPISTPEIRTLILKAFRIREQLC